MIESVLNKTSIIHLPGMVYLKWLLLLKALMINIIFYGFGKRRLFSLSFKNSNSNCDSWEITEWGAQGYHRRRRITSKYTFIFLLTSSNKFLIKNYVVPYDDKKNYQVVKRSGEIFPCASLSPRLLLILLDRYKKSLGNLFTTW